MPEPLYHRGIFCVMSKKNGFLDYFADFIDKITNLNAPDFGENQQNTRFLIPSLQAN